MKLSLTNLVLKALETTFPGSSALHGPHPVDVPSQAESLNVKPSKLPRLASLLQMQRASSSEVPSEGSRYPGMILLSAAAGSKPVHMQKMKRANRALPAWR